MEQNELTAFVGQQLTQVGIDFYITGSVASGVYGESRTTNDVDIVADVHETQVDPLLARFPEPDFYFSRDAALQAVRDRSQFNIIDKDSFIKVDVIVPAATAQAATRLSRRITRTLAPGVTLPVASPEDVIVMKLVFYEEGGSEKHLRDIAGILQNHRVRIDDSYVRSSARAMNVEAAWDVVLSRINDAAKE